MPDELKVYDQHGIEILVGDTLKVFHFIGPRRKRFYMYKHVIARETLGTVNPAPFYRISHLDLKPDSYYWEQIDGGRLGGVEIVQGYGTDGTPYDQRPKKLDHVALQR